MKLTEEQLLIINENYEKGDIVKINAFSGVGKTATLKYIAENNRDKKLLYLAFNKAIVNEALSKFPRNTTIKTIHSLAYGNIGFKYKDKLSKPLKKYHIKNFFNMEDNEDQDILVGVIEKVLLNFLCSSDTTITEKHIYDVYLMPEELEKNKKLILNNTIKLWKAVSDYNNDFPTLHDVYLKMYQLSKPKLHYPIILTDECLPYHIPVLLADGTSKSIGEIVESKEHVEVLSFDEKTKKQKKCKVIGWSKNPNIKPMVKISLKTKKRISDSGTRYTNFVVCTIDHKIFTYNRGWVEAGNIKNGDICQIETSAQKTKKYKISQSGKNKLSTIMDEKNKKGLMRNTDTNKSMWKGGKFNRGGNGKGLTEPQKFLLSALKEKFNCYNWEPELKVKTLDYRNKYNTPSSYKIDIGCEDIKLAIEIDGNSHQSISRKKQDEKKELVLKKLGWKAIRIKNLEVFHSFENVLQKIGSFLPNNDCPIESEVVKVEETSTNEYFTYDITVENCHNFYANGVLVHNCQDISPCIFDILNNQKQSAIIYVGDRHQSIYQFRGAVNIMELITPTKEFYLSKSFRFKENIAYLANIIINNFKKETKKIVHNETFEADGKTCFIARTNNTVFKEAIERKGSLFFVGGLHTYPFSNIYDTLYLWRNEKDKIKNAFIKSMDDIQTYQEYGMTMHDCEVMAACSLVFDYGNALFKLLPNIRKRTITDEDKADHILTTAHKSKGKEWENIELANDFNPIIVDEDKINTGFLDECEINILYVSITRAKNNVKLNNDLCAFFDRVKKRYPFYFPKDKKGNIYNDEAVIFNVM
jgi:very-short-patch-repair endonuclease